MPDTHQPATAHAIVEIFGHQRIAGAVSEQTLAGTGFIRVDVPEVTYADVEYVDGIKTETLHTIGAHTCTLGPASIFRLHWVDQATAELVAHQVRHAPVQPYELRDGLERLTSTARRLLLDRGTPDADHPF